MKKILFSALAAAVAVSGCVTVYDPIPLGQGRYSLQALDSSSYTSSDALAAAVAQANVFCAQTAPGTEAVVETAKTADYSWTGYANAQTIFTCQPKGGAAAAKKPQ